MDIDIPLVCCPTTIVSVYIIRLACCLRFCKLKWKEIVIGRCTVVNEN